MSLRYQVGQKFPAFTLLDERGREATLDDVSGGQPLVLVFYRGPW